MPADKKYTHRCFRGANGDSEHFFVLYAPKNLTFEEQTAWVYDQYVKALKDQSLGSETAVFKRIFVSDAINQSEVLHQSPLFAETKNNPVAVSFVQQSPLPASKIALLAYHIDSKTPVVKKRLSSRHMLVEKGVGRHLWSTQMCCRSHAATSSEELQTREVFDELTGALAHHDANIKDHCVRTWIYIKDVDVFYRGMVKSRRDLFIEEGLTEDTHYIASTGIEGACDHQFDLVLMDAYSVLNLDQKQVFYLNDFDHLCPTKDYQVTFERGTRIAFKDRAHHYISGTASIDNLGNTLFLGDIMKQLERTLENIDVLLKSGGATIDDMMYFIVYLRDSADYANVAAALRARFPETPTVIVRGAVCRPEWLIEIEGVAAIAHNDPSLPPF